MITSARRRSSLYVFLISIFFVFFPPQSNSAANKVYVIELSDDIINPVTVEYISRNIDKAQKDDVQCLIIKLDTPGGLLNSTRLIVKKMLMAEVPVIVYISPSGAHAGSAGVFITYASHIAAMAPSTNIGAAHPVEFGGGRSPEPSEDWAELKKLIEDLKEKRDEASYQDKSSGRESKKTAQPATVDKKEDLLKEDTSPSQEKFERDANPMESKILNDTVAFIKAIAQKRNRNLDWAVESVVKSLSITDTEALDKKVVEIIARDEADLLNQLDGRIVQLKEETRTLQTKNAVIERIGMDARQKFFNTIANPNIAYFLLILGFYGLLFEITHPGNIFPGVIGAIFLILAFYSMQMLPTNYAGLALLLLGVCLLVAEAIVPGFGIMAVGGIACLILGSMLLFESTNPFLRVSRSMIFAFSASTGIVTLLLVQAALRSHRLKVKGGQEGLIGKRGEALTRISPNQKGKVFVHGERWNALSSEEIKNGDPIVVVKVDGLSLFVKKE